MKTCQELKVPTEAILLQLLPIETDEIHALGRDYESVIEFVIIC